MKERFRYRAGLPRTGWMLTATSDHEAATFTCENCAFPHVRYVHQLVHEKSRRQVRVGCICAEHLTQDFSTPRLRERSLKTRSGRRMRWPTLNWKLSGKGNLYLKKSGVIIVVRQGRSGGWAASYKPSEGSDWVPVPGWHNTPEAAKLAAFDTLYPS